jgi:hypothetical protein
MTTESAYSGDDPHQLLMSARDLAQRVRRAQRATWFPLLVFAAATFAAIPVFRYGSHHPETCATVPGGRICTIYSTASFVYWPVALVLAYVAIAAFYIRRSRAQGVGTRVRPYVIAGIIVAALATGASLWWVHNPPTNQYGQLVGMGVLGQLISPGAAIGLALLVLAWAERNRALLLLTLGYLAVVLVPIRFGWVPGSPWHFLPSLVIQGSVLLLGGVGFALAQRPARVPAA